jgi:hypothetical protein
VYSGCPPTPAPAPLPLPATADADAPTGPAYGPLLNDVDVTLEPPGIVVVVTLCWSPMAEPEAMLLPSDAMLVMEIPGGPLPKAVTVLPSGVTYVCWVGPPVMVHMHQVSKSSADSTKT